MIQLLEKLSNYTGTKIYNLQIRRPKEYYYRSLVEMFLEVAMRQLTIISFPKFIARYRTILYQVRFAKPGVPL